MKLDPSIQQTWDSLHAFERQEILLDLVLQAAKSGTDDAAVIIRRLSAPTAPPAPATAPAAATTGAPYEQAGVRAQVSAQTWAALNQLNTQVTAVVAQARQAAARQAAAARRARRVRAARVYGTPLAALLTLGLVVLIALAESNAAASRRSLAALEEEVAGLNAGLEQRRLELKGADAEIRRLEALIARAPQASKALQDLQGALRQEKEKLAALDASVQTLKPVDEQLTQARGELAKLPESTQARRADLDEQRARLEKMEAALPQFREALIRTITEELRSRREALNTLKTQAQAARTKSQRLPGAPEAFGQIEKTLASAATAADVIEQRLAALKSDAAESSAITEAFASIDAAKEALDKATADASNQLKQIHSLALPPDLEPAFELPSASKDAYDNPVRAELDKASGWPLEIRHKGTGMHFVLIPAGEFQMGSDDGQNDEKTVHKVKITKPFYLGKYEVTQAEWEKVMGRNPSNFKSDRNPVEKVSWDDCQKFIKKLNTPIRPNSHTPTPFLFALPTEAEWEYACRAGTTTRFSFGDEESSLGDYGWYSSNSGSKTHPVGEKKPNVWGLYDLHGNVWEWCEDWYGDYPKGEVTDPRGPDGGRYRVSRGGSWVSDAAYCRSADRFSDSPGDRYSFVGCRLSLRSSP